MSHRVCNLVWLDDVHQPITAGMLYGADFEDGILSGRLSRERGVTPSFEITLSHPGWALYSPTNKRAAALVIHTDGTLATARVLARGWLRDLPSTMTGEEITLIFECRADSDDDHDDAKEEAAREVVMADIARPRPFSFPGDGTARATPFRDLLFGRLQKLSDEVLQGRSAWWRYDPVTHAITLREGRAPARLRHNVGDGYDNLQTSPGEGAVSEIRWRLVAEIRQQASGTTNFGPLMGSISTLSGYTVQAPKSLGTNYGWSFNTSAAVVEHTTSETGWFNTGRSWQYEQRRIYYVKSQTSSGAEAVNTSYGTKFTYSTDEQYKVRRHDYTFLTFPATYNYSQDRKEVLELVLRVPCQQAGGIRRTINLGETSIGSLYTPVIDTIADQDEDEPTQIPAEMQDGGQYQTGDYAYYGDTLYRARRDNPGQLYTNSFKRGQLVTRISDGWAAVGVLSPIRDRSTPTFWPSPRGKACVAHAFRRMAAQAIERLYSWGATLTVQREYLEDVELEDEIAFLVPGRWDEPMKAVLGEISKIEDAWDGDAGDTVTLTVKVATGTGLNDEADVTRMQLGDFDADDFEAADFEIETAYATDSDLVAFAVNMGPLDQRVDIRRLADPTYALRQIEFTGSAEEQLAEYMARAAANMEPVADGVTTPTSIALGLVSLASVPTLERRGTAVGELLYSPRGIVL